MNLTSIPASLIILVLTLYLCIYIYRKDTIEKEPLSLLGILFGAGILCFVACAYLEQALVGGIDNLFLPYMSFDGNGLQFYTSKGMRIAHLMSCAAAVAIIEEVTRGILLGLITHKNKNFNYTFDGMVYALILYLGYGMMEAFRYVQSGGFGSVLLRAICLIPAHLFLGVIMGCFYTGWHKATLEMKKHGKKGKLPIFILIPIIVHMIYCFFSMYASSLGGYVYEIVAVVLCVIGIVVIRRKASKDTMIAMMLCIVMVASLMTPMESEAVEYRVYSGFYYDQLDVDGLSVYNDMMKEIPKGNLSSTVTLPYFVYDWNEIWKGVHAFHLEHPEYYWLNGGVDNASCNKGDKIKLSINYQTHGFWSQTLDKKGEQKKLNDVVQSIVKEAKKRDKKINQIQYVHDYIANNCIYDYDKLNSSKKTIHDPFDDLIYTAYGCLVQKRAVCAGYAKAFEMIMHELGYTCEYVKGKAGDSPNNMQGHGWNRITLDGETYWVDTTWDDLDQKGKDNDAMHTYFMQTTQTMLKDHMGIDSFTHMAVPTADGTTYQYHKYYKFTLKTYNLAALDEILYKQRKKELREVHFTSSDEYKKALSAIKNGKCYPPKTYGNKGYSYWDDADYRNLIFLK